MKLEGLSSQKRNGIFIILMVGTVVSSMLQTSLTTALPVIMKEFGILATTAQWLTSAYSLAMGVMIPATAFLLKRFPTKPLFLAGMTVFVFGLCFSGLSTSFPMLLMGRILQALGNGLFLSMTQVVIITIFPARQRGAVMGIYGLAVGAAPAIAPTLTGMVIDSFGWRVVFWGALVIAVVDWIAACFSLENVLDTEKLSFDFASMALSTLGFVALLLGSGNIGTANFFTPSIGGALLLGFGALGLFVWRQNKLKEPFLEIKTLKTKNFRTAVILSMVLYAVMISGSTLIPLYVQSVRGLSATMSGLIMMPGSLTMAAISPITGRIYDKHGIKRLALIGSICMTVSCIAFIFVGESTAIWYLMLFYSIQLIAIGCIMMPLLTWGMSALPVEFASHGTALFATLRTIAGALGSAVFVAVMTYVSTKNGATEGVSVTAKGVNFAFLIITLLSVVQLLMVHFAVERKKHIAGEEAS